MRLWRALPLYDGRASFSTWLYVIARNACLSELRRRGVRPVTALEDVQRAGRARRRRRRRPRRASTVRRWSRACPSRSGEIVRLFYLEERSYEQVAAMLDMPINTVRSHLHRARKRLAQAMATCRGVIR